MHSLKINTELGAGSIMHYGPRSFAKDPNKVTIEALNGAEIGQRRAFSKVSDCIQTFIISFCNE